MSFMRKAKLYFKLFLPLIALLLVSVCCALFLPSNLDSFKTNLIATALGVAITISFAEALKQLAEHKRRKKTAGLLKMVTIPYLQNQCLNFKENSKLYKDMGDWEHAKAFLLLVTNYHRISADFDKNWFQLIYSTDFIDTIDSDSQMNAIGHAVSEVLIFNKTITWHSLNASRLLDLLRRLEADGKITKEDVVHMVAQARAIRDSVDESIEKLVKFTDELNRELDAIFAKTGVGYEEIER
jgi:uncharacterized membrane protein